MKRVIVTVSKILSFVIRAVLLALLIALVTPIGYFAWRANQPMEMPEFGGRTYIELLLERRQAYVDRASDHQSSHPNRDANYLACFLPEVGVQIFGAFPNAGFYALAGIYPTLQKHVNPKDLREGLVPEGVTWLKFLPAWWETYEKFIWGMAEHAPRGPVPYCRISPTT